MSTCKKCNAINDDGAKFCGECGKPMKAEKKKTGSEYVVVVLGAGGVGKSALTVKFVHGQFVEKYNPTIEDSFNKTSVIDDFTCRLSILDTAGTETFTALRQLYFEKGDGFILVYSITQVATFKEVQVIQSQIQQKLEREDMPLCLVGNKCDLEDKRKVTVEEGKNLATKLSSNSSFFEASAKNGKNVNEVFDQIIRQIWKNVGKPQKSKGGCMIL
eukprot:TRINITY_DN4316_c0_g1_i1.p1 TRINITY_DN4316_c0_g1~~TRINITY_DN4316_c0_g1_i1.p1  ORF type:complete len:216 (+),score=48.94 TRINITY_DN4316_c0_g1_i1:122-769(+)